MAGMDGFEHPDALANEGFPVGIGFEGTEDPRGPIFFSEGLQASMAVSEGLDWVAYGFNRFTDGVGRFMERARAHAWRVGMVGVVGVAGGVLPMGHADAQEASTPTTPAAEEVLLTDSNADSTLNINNPACDPAHPVQFHGVIVRSPSIRNGDLMGVSITSDPDHAVIGQTDIAGSSSPGVAQASFLADTTKNRDLHAMVVVTDLTTNTQVANFPDAEFKYGCDRPAGEISATGDTPPPPPPPDTKVPSEFEGITPTRVFDTRSGMGGRLGEIPAGATATFTIPNVPAGATAVAVTLTAIGNKAGFVTAWGGGAQPTASVLNIQKPGEIVPNTVVLPLGPGGTINVYSQSGIQLVGDVGGFFVAAPNGSAGGRLIDTVQEERDYDSRPDVNPIDGPFKAGEARKIKIPGAAAAGAKYVRLNITATNPKAAGYLTAWPTGQPQPLASVVNFDPAFGNSVANNGWFPLGADGSVMVYASAGTDVIVDLEAAFTGPDAAVTTQGEFVPFGPKRDLDTRIDPGRKAKAGEKFALDLAKLGLDPSLIEAVEANATFTDATKDQFVALYGVNYHGTSISNGSGTRANEGIALTPAFMLSSEETHLIADVSGYYLAAPKPNTTVSDLIKAATINTTKPATAVAA